MLWEGLLATTRAFNVTVTIATTAVAMAETGLPLGAVYTGATPALMAEARQTAESSPQGYIPTVFDPSTCSRKGYSTVARDRVPAGKNKAPSEDACAKGAKPPRTTDDEGQPWRGFDMYYEVHGTGKRRVIFIMGLNNSCFGWLNQVEHVAKDPRCSALVFDNRGYGNSEIPAAGYTTSEMALDVLELVDSLGWNEKLHLVGVSMGGMISLEMAKAVPERIASLTLISTTSGRGNGEKYLSTSLPPWTGLSTITRLISGRIIGFDSDAYRVNSVMELLFPPSWLAQTNEKAGGKTNAEIMKAMFAYRYGFARRQSIFGALAQVRAVITHRISPAQLRAIDESVPTITIVTGDADNLVNPLNSEHLAKHMKRARLVRVPNAGHALPVQVPDVINTIIDKAIDVDT